MALNMPCQKSRPSLHRRSHNRYGRITDALFTLRKHDEANVKTTTILGWMDGEPSDVFLSAFSASSPIPGLSFTVPPFLSSVVPLVSRAPQVLNVELDPVILMHWKLASREKPPRISELLVLRLPPGLDCSDISEGIKQVIWHHYVKIELQ